MQAGSYFTINLQNMNSISITDFLTVTPIQPIPLSVEQLELLQRALLVFQDKLDPDLPVGRQKIEACNTLQTVLEFGIKKAQKVNEAIIANLQNNQLHTIDVTQG